MPVVRPGMAFAPQPEMMRVHHLDLGAAVVLFGQQVLHLLEIADQVVVVLRLEMLVLVAHLRRIARPGALQFMERHFFQHEVGQRVFQDVGIVEHHADAHALVILERLLHRDLPVVVEFQLPFPLLDMPPVRADVHFGAQRETEQPVDGLFQGLSGHERRAEIPGDIRNQPHSHAVDQLLAGLGGLVAPAAVEVVRFIAAERTLVQTVADRRPRAEIIPGPVMDRHPALQDRRKPHSRRSRQGRFQKIPSLHIIILLRLPDQLHTDRFGLAGRRGYLIFPEHPIACEVERDIRPHIIA